MTDKHVTDPVSSARETQDFHQEDEVSLIDLWRVITKRKRFVFITVAVVFSLVGMWLLIAKPVYESRAVLGLGQVGSIESPQLVVQRLKEEYRVKDDSEGERPLPLLSAVKIMDKTLANGIELVVQAHSAEEARQFLDSIIGTMMQRHKRLFDLGRIEQQNQLASLERHRQAIERGLGTIRERITALSRGDASLAGLLTLEQDRLIQQLPQVEQQIAVVRLAMSELQSSPTFMLRQPTLPVEPVKPKPALYMVLAGMVGLMLGIFGAFFAEFIGKMRKQLQVTSADRL